MAFTSLVFLFFLITVGSFLMVTANDIFVHEVKDSNGNVVSMQKYKDAKAILIGTIFESLFV
jgi:hypothetical protein